MGTRRAVLLGRGNYFFTGCSGVAYLRPNLPFNKYLSPWNTLYVLFGVNTHRLALCAIAHRPIARPARESHGCRWSTDIWAPSLMDWNGGAEAWHAAQHALGGRQEEVREQEAGGPERRILQA